MADAKLTWNLRLPPHNVLMRELGRTIEEATGEFPSDWFPRVCIEGVEWEKYAWPGGYPLYYVVQDGGCLCSKCANENLELTLGDDPAWKITQVDINYEDTTLYCDNCNEFMESAYGEENGTSDE